MKLHKMIEIYLKYDKMHTFGMINALNCINNHVNSSINSMLSINKVDFLKTKNVPVMISILPNELDGNG